MMATTSLPTTKSSTVTLRQAFAGVPLAAQAVLDSPIGPLTALATERGIAGLWFDDQTHHPGALDAPHDDGDAHIVAMQRWLDAYWAGHDPSWMHVSAGAGTSPYTPVRFACRPEATLLTLTGIDSAGLPA